MLDCFNLNLSGRRLRKFNQGGAISRQQPWHSTDNEDYLAEMKQFVCPISHNERPLCNGHETLAVLRQVLAARQMSVRYVA